MIQKSRIPNIAVVVFLFISGAAGLVYEIVWARYLALFLGHTSYAVLMVLVVFMGGLAAGGLLLGKRADRARQPLAMYGWLELGIGIYGLIFPWYYALCWHAYVGLVRTMQPGDAVHMALKFSFSVMTILLPTVLMGGTLPVLAKFVTHSLAEFRGRVAALYAINSAGAVAGCLLADFWLIPAMGLGPTVRWAAGMNLVAGVGALAVNRWVRPPAPAATSKAQSPTVTERFSTAEMKLALIGIGVSGFVAMLYEVAWTRLLALVLGSSTHAFSIMLATFIAGIAAGAWVLGRWRGLRRTLDAFAWAEIAVAVAVVVSMFAYSYLPLWFARVASLLARREAAYPLFEGMQALICFGVMFAPTVCLGMTLPLVSRIATQDVAETGGAVGRVYAVNTLGTVLGAALTGLWLMPQLGLARTFALGAAANAAVGLAILGRNGRTRPWLAGGIALVLAIGLVVGAGSWFDRWPQRLVMGLWRVENLPANRKEFELSADSHELKFYRDGPGSTVSVNTFIDARGKQSLSLRVNGKPDAGTSVDMPTQLLLGHLPMLLHPQSRQALVIGLGSGMTCGAIATHPSVQRLDVVEISPEVVEAARVFAADNDNVLDNPRVRVTVEDAKSFLQVTPNAYDVIVSEPSNPWVAGVAGVFTREFYQSCRARLSPGGLMTQWVQLYETSDEALDIVLRTFTEVFPYTSVWRVRKDMILIGSAQPTAVDLSALEERFNHPTVKTDLDRIGMTRVPLLLASEIISPEDAAFAAPDRGPRHSDESPALEFVAQRAFFAREQPQRLSDLDETEAPHPSTLLGQYLKSRELTIEDVRAFASFQEAYDHPSSRIVHSLVLRWQQLHPADPLPFDLASRQLTADATAGPAVQLPSAVRDAIWQQAATDPTQLVLYRSLLWKSYEAQRSAFYVPPADELRAVLGRLLETDPANQRVYKFELAGLAWDAGNDQTFIRLALNALDLSNPGSNNFDLHPELVPEIISRLAEAAWHAGQNQMALRLCKLADDASYTSPRLEMVERKLRAHLTRRAGGS